MLVSLLAIITILGQFLKSGFPGITSDLLNLNFWGQAKESLCVVLLKGSGER